MQSFGDKFSSQNFKDTVAISGCYRDCLCILPFNNYNIWLLILHLVMQALHRNSTPAMKESRVLDILNAVRCLDYICMQ